MVAETTLVLFVEHIFEWKLWNWVKIFDKQSVLFVVNSYFPAHLWTLFTGSILGNAKKKCRSNLAWFLNLYSLFTLEALDFTDKIFVCRVESICCHKKYYYFRTGKFTDGRNSEKRTQPRKSLEKFRRKLHEEKKIRKMRKIHGPCEILNNISTKITVLKICAISFNCANVTRNSELFNWVFLFYWTHRKKIGRATGRKYLIRIFF